MDTTTPTAAGLPNNEGRAHEVHVVRRILIILGVLLAIAGGVFFFTAERQLDKEIEQGLGMPMAEFRQLPEEVTSVVEITRKEDLVKRRIAFGCALGAGVILLLLGLATTRRLRTAVLVSLIVIVLAGVAFGLLMKRKVDVEAGGPAELTPTEMKIEKTVIWALLIASFVSLIYAGRMGAHHAARTSNAPA